MNAPFIAEPLRQPKQLREIPYNYTSFSDREIALRYLGDAGWQLIQSLRNERRTGQSARMLFEVLGDLWVIDRNPFIQEDMLGNRRRREALVSALKHRVSQIVIRGNSDPRVQNLIELANQAVERFEYRLKDMQSLRRRTTHAMRDCTHSDNVRFDGLARVSHVTDATDWRVELPFVVLTPDNEEELPALVKACIRLKLTIIPRGGGTGYTGGAIPLHANTAVINLEKLDTLDTIIDSPLPASEELLETPSALTTAQHNQGRFRCCNTPGSRSCGSQRIGICSRPYVSRCIYHRWQHCHECRWQEGSVVGHHY